MLLRAAEAAADDLAIRLADHQAAGHLQQAAPGALFQLTPQFVRAPQQRDVRRVLEIREPDHTRAAVARSLIVCGLILLEAEDPLAPRCRMRRGRAPHAAEADDNHIETG